jgi:WD40 repeat protein
MFSDYSVTKFLLLSDESVAICTTDGEVRVWDFNQYKADYISPIKRLIHPNRVEAIEELSNGIIVTGCYDKIIRFWDITDPLKGACINQILNNDNDFQFFSLPNNRLFSRIGYESILIGSEIQDTTEYTIWDFNDLKNIKKFNLPKLGSMVSKFYLLNDLRLVVAYHNTIRTPVIPPKIVVWDLTVTPPTAITLFETRLSDIYKVTFLGELEPGIIICSYLTIRNENWTCVWDINQPLPTSKLYIGISIVEVLVDNRILYLQKNPSVDASYSSYHIPGWGLSTFPGIDGESYYLHGITAIRSNKSLGVGRVPAREILTFPIPPVPTPSYSKLKDFELSDEITLKNYLQIKSQVECSICKVNIKKIMLNCNHSFCETCSSTLENCPKCESTIGSKEKINNKYISY